MATRFYITLRSSPFKVQSCVVHWCEEKEIRTIFSLFSLIPKGCEKILSSLLSCLFLPIYSLQIFRVFVSIANFSMFFIGAHPAKIGKKIEIKSSFVRRSPVCQAFLFGVGCCFGQGDSHVLSRLPGKHGLHAAEFNDSSDSYETTPKREYSGERFRVMLIKW